MQHQLDPIMETLFLLMNTPWQEKKRAEAIRILDSTGVDGAAFYDRNGALVERYFAAFETKRKESLGTQILSDADNFLLSLYIRLFRKYPQWVEDIASATDDELAEAVRSQLVNVLEGQEDIITGMEELGIADRSKWQAMLFLQKPRRQLSVIFQAVSDHLPAFEKAKDEVAGEMDGLWAQFDALSKDTYGSWPLDLTRLFESSAPILPSLAMPFSVLVTDQVCFCGLLCYKLFRSAGGELSKEELVVCAKALSDKSKVEILLCLREKSLYGLELAEKIGLTPATVSHHMGMLLATGFVELEKRNGKVYYRLSKIGVQKFLSGTGRLLL